MGWVPNGLDAWSRSALFWSAKLSSSDTRRNRNVRAPLIRHTPLLHRGLALAVGVFLFCVAPGSPVEARAQGRSLEIESFQTEIRIQPDGTLDVAERLDVRFTGSWNGIFRDIPVEYDSGYGTNYTLRIDEIVAEDGAGTPLVVEEGREGRYRTLRIYVPDAVNATRTVVIRYRVRDGLRFFEEHDELYWNVTGDESEVPIGSASARVWLPDGASGVRSTAFAGPRGAVGGDVEITEGEGVIDFETSAPLGFREGLTVVVGWNPGPVERPTALDRAGHVLASNLILVVPLAVALAMLLVWRRHGRDPDLGAIAPEYEPPTGLTPGEAGTLFDTRPDMRDVTATIVDLAVRGFLIIEETEKAHLLGLFSTDAYTFRLKAPRSAWEELKPHERALLSGMFKGFDVVDTTELENTFYKVLPEISSKLSRTLVDDGHYLHDPRRVQTFFVLFGIFSGLTVGLLGALVLERLLGQGPGAAIAAGILTGFAVAGFGLFMPARTQHGAQVLRRIRGFEEFLRRVESDRFERMVRTPEMFERFLPYAMAFGVERNWAAAFDGIYQSPPNWYHGRSPVGFRPHAFAHSLGRMSTVTGAAMTSAPRSSARSSGFGGGGGFRGGGGFSGGGFGGGRVGGF